MSINSNVSYGRALMDAVASQIPTFGRIFIVKNSSDAADPNYVTLDEVFKTDTNGQVRVFTSLSDAYNATTTNNNDVILLDAHTSHKVTSMLTVSKNKVHFVGMEGTDRLTNQRAMISNSGTGAATDVAMIKVTGSGVTFRNISFKNNWTVAQNLYSVWLLGASNSYFQNCTIQNLGSAHLTNASAAMLAIDGSEDSEFVKCTIGADTVLVTAVANHVCLITGAVTRTTFRDCMFRNFTNKTTGVMVAIVGNGVNNLQLFRNCAFLNRVNGGATAAVAVSADGTTAGDVVFDVNTFAAGVTDFATAAVGNTGMFIASPVPTAGTSGIAVTPTA